MKTPMSVFVLGVAGCFSSALLHAALVPPAAAADSLNHSEPAATAFHDRSRREGPSQRDLTHRDKSKRAGLAAQKGQTAVGTLVTPKKSSADQHTYYLSTNQSWVWMNPPYGSTQTISSETDQLVITAQTANLSAGTYSAVVYIVDSGPNNFNNMLRIPVTLTVTATPVSASASPPAPPSTAPLSCTPPPPPAHDSSACPARRFNHRDRRQSGGPGLDGSKGQTAVGTLALRKAGTDQHSYYLSTNQSWIWMNPPYGSTQSISSETDQLVITAQTANLSAGTYSAVVYVVDSGPNNFNNMLRIPVTLTVTATPVALVTAVASTGASCRDTAAAAGHDSPAGSGFRRNLRDCH